MAAKVKELGARRVVFDGIDVLLSLLDDTAAERAELYRIHEWLIEHDVTGIVTAKADGTDPLSQARYGFAAYMADCALLLMRRHEALLPAHRRAVVSVRTEPMLSMSMVESILSP